MNIPKKFCNAKDPNYPVNVQTVGELIEALKELPPELQVNQEYGDDGGADVIVYNVSDPIPHLELRETNW